ncbi:hypothetical protein V6N12_011793 [Hibiscus sabdariffa]|uniref:Secreted protein n=1 Tax=Hibiscus sabdariffa TaxID=183260 RepID=A0ABR2BTV8_9ROSI
MRNDFTTILVSLLRRAFLSMSMVCHCPLREPVCPRVNPTFNVVFSLSFFVMPPCRSQPPPMSSGNPSSQGETLVLVYQVEPRPQLGHLVSGPNL